MLSKDDRAMRPIYKLFHPNFVYTYGHYTLCGFDSERIQAPQILFIFCKSDILAVQGHPRTLILVPIESAYATSY